MSNPAERIAEDNYERENDASPVPGNVIDSSYAEEPNPNLRDKVPIQPDDQSFEDPMQPPYSNSDQQLEKDESEAIDKSNVLRESVSVMQSLERRTDTMRGQMKMIYRPGRSDSQSCFYQFVRDHPYIEWVDTLPRADV
ncbi:hypothetical protein N7497_007833 [Penicillium chrysogenum]|nr:hypothetical protein N7497_007833 [Penicillium chrysogenum]